MRVRYVSDMILTERLQQTSLSQVFWKRQSRYSRLYRDGNAISAESRSTRIFRRTAASMLNLLRTRLDIRSLWFQTDRDVTISFIVSLRYQNKYWMRGLPRCWCSGGVFAWKKRDSPIHVGHQDSSHLTVGPSSWVVIRTPPT